MNIKNPLFNANGGFFVFVGGWCGQEMAVLLRWQWEWQGSVQREGQAHSPTKSEGDSAVLEGVGASDGW